MLYVGLGMLRWRLDNDGAGGDEIFSPLLLIPVTLDRPSPRDPYRLKRGEDDLQESTRPSPLGCSPISR